VSSLPIYTSQEVEDADNTPCKGCSLRPLWPKMPGCIKAPIRRWDLAGSDHKPEDPVDLLIVGDPPTKEDALKDNYFSDELAQDILIAVKEHGYKSIAMVPSVRCYATGTVDPYVLTKKYKGSFTAKKSAKERAQDAAPVCKEYTRRAMMTFRPKVTLALGGIAAEVLDKDKSILNLRTTPIHPKPGFNLKPYKTGTIFTLDRGWAQYGGSAKTTLFADLSRLSNITKTGKPTVRGTYNTIVTNILDTTEAVKDFVDFVLTASWPEDTIIHFDYEALNTDYNAKTNRLLNVGFSLSTNEDVAFVVPLYHPGTPFAPQELEEVMGHLRCLFEAKDSHFAGWCAHYAPFEIKITKLFFGVFLQDTGKVVYDTMNLAHQADENRKKSGISEPLALETLVADKFGFTWYEESKVKDKRDRLVHEPIKLVNHYVGVDAVMTNRLFHQLVEEMTEEGSADDILRVATRLMSDVLLTTCEMSLNGLELDADLLFKLRAPDSSVRARLAEVDDIIQNHPDVKKALEIVEETEFNFASIDHRMALFDSVLELDGAEEGQDKEFQERHKNNQLVALFTEHQGLSKLDQSYLAPLGALLQHPNCADGRIHPTFNVADTVTHRLSTRDPNYANQPRGDTRDKKQIKALVRTRRGRIIVQLDYSQAEIRWWGILAGDPVLAARYRRAAEIEEGLMLSPKDPVLLRAKALEGDLHTSTAISMYKLDPDLVLTDPSYLKKRRQTVKSLAFGLMYGKNARSLAKDLNIPVEEAEATVDQYLNQFPQAKQWLTDVEEQVIKTGYITTPFGRWRRLHFAKSSDVSVANRAKRQTRNSPIQSAASDCCLYAMSQLRHAMRKHPLLQNVLLINTVYDSVIAEMDDDPEVIKAYCELAKSIFTDENLLMDDFGIEITVPLQVDFDLGFNWANMEDYNFTDEALHRAIHNARVLREAPTGALFDDLAGTSKLIGYDRREGKVVKEATDTVSVRFGDNTIVDFPKPSATLAKLVGTTAACWLEDQPRITTLKNKEGTLWKE
jgi:DNA polymerase I-like protein with 3'-5' exonuclease and polymerase domains/uracil-DNA glycosylase